MNVQRTGCGVPLIPSTPARAATAAGPKRMITLSAELRAVVGASAAGKGWDNKSKLPKAAHRAGRNGMRKEIDRASMPPDSRRNARPSTPCWAESPYLRRKTIRPLLVS